MGATEPAASCPCVAATVLCHASGGRATGSCLERGLHPVKETTSPCTTQEMTVERPMTSSVHRSGGARCVDGGVDVLNAGCTPSRKHASPHGSVCGSLLKPTHEVGQACAVMSPHVVSRCSEKPKAPAWRGAGSHTDGAAIPRSNRRQQPKSLSGASARGGEADEDQTTGSDARGGDAAAAATHVRTTPLGVRRIQ